MGKEPLYAVYPADGVAVGDSPLGFIDHGRGPEVEKFFTDLLAYLQSDDVRKRIAETGRRSAAWRLGDPGGGRSRTGISIRASS